MVGRKTRSKKYSLKKYFIIFVIDITNTLTLYNILTFLKKEQQILDGNSKSRNVTLINFQKNLIFLCISKFFPPSPFAKNNHEKPVISVKIVLQSKHGPIQLFSFCVTNVRMYIRRINIRPNFF